MVLSTTMFNGKISLKEELNQVQYFNKSIQYDLQLQFTSRPSNLNGRVLSCFLVTFAEKEIALPITASKTASLSYKIKENKIELPTLSFPSQEKVKNDFPELTPSTKFRIKFMLDAQSVYSSEFTLEVARKKTT